MKNEIKFDFFEPPRGKERPRMCFKNGRTIAYTPKPTRSYEKRLGSFVSKLMRKKGWKRFEGKIPLKCIIQAFYPIPSATSKSITEKMQSGEILPACTPDCDNVLKIILDALNGVVYEDDKQICNVIFSKNYSLVPKIRVQIREIKTPKITKFI